jgi:hypothetical protein
VSTLVIFEDGFGINVLDVGVEESLSMMSAALVGSQHRVCTSLNQNP